jgi:methylmalonyl-CoA carboxyltransferase 5S subunit
MFPQVAPKFFAERANGPRNVGTPAPKSADGVALKAPPTPASPAVPDGSQSGTRPLPAPVDFEVRVGERVHRVSVQPAA